MCTAGTPGIAQAASKVAGVTMAGSVVEGLQKRKPPQTLLTQTPGALALPAAPMASLLGG